mmetsp:Transcript_67509/g.162024  ORF Transcript_67509/g.162024 Transcript_67509/m.162024 type:complete len:632 (+) Transcript_67509:78-1973(+)
MDAGLCTNRRLSRKRPVRGSPGAMASRCAAGAAGPSPKKVPQEQQAPSSKRFDVEAVRPWDPSKLRPGTHFKGVVSSEAAPCSLAAGRMAGSLAPVAPAPAAASCQRPPSLMPPPQVPAAAKVQPASASAASSSAPPAGPSEPPVRPRARLVRLDLLPEEVLAKVACGSPGEALGEAYAFSGLPWHTDARSHPRGSFSSPSVVYLYPGRELKFGRDPEWCSLVMESAEAPQMISRRHACLVDAEGKWLLKEEKSLNGLLVNQVRLTAPRLLRHGDVVCFGKKIDKTVFEYLFEERCDEKNAADERPPKRARLADPDAVPVGETIAAAGSRQSTVRKDPPAASSTAPPPPLAGVQTARGTASAPVIVDIVDSDGAENVLQAEMGQLLGSDLARVAQEKADLEARRVELDAKLKELETRQKESSAQAAQAAPKSIVDLKELQSELVCSICQDWIIHASSLECGHMFCRECVDQWLTHKHFQCPVCRAEVRQEPTAARTLDVIVAKTIQRSDEKERAEFQRRVKNADELQEKRKKMQHNLEQSVKKALKEQKSFFHVDQNWSAKEKKTFHDGVKSYICEAREAYCQLVGLTVSWVHSADDSKLNQALHNLGLRDFVSKSEKTIRQRLLMYLRYG